MRFRVGDKVRVINLDRWGVYKDHNGHNALGITEQMYELKGKIVTITRMIHHKNAYRIKEDNGSYFWNDAMLLPATQNKYRIKGGISNV